MRSSTNKTSCEQYLDSRLAWGSRDVKSSFPGLLWCDASTTFASVSSARVEAVALILVSSRIWCVDGSRGTLMSTLRKTLLPSVSKSSSVRKLYFANFRGPSFHQGQRVELHRFNLFVRNPFSRRASAPFSPGWLSLARPLNGEPQRRTHILKCERSGGRGFDYPTGIESPAPGTLLASSQNVNAAVFSAHVGDVAHS